MPRGKARGPHPEERPFGRVSKDGGDFLPWPPSFETLASQAPQDEDWGHASNYLQNNSACYVGAAKPGSSC
jgi:hypothetical protein